MTNVEISEMLVRLRALVERESPSSDLDALRHCGALFTRWLKQVTGRSPEPLEVEGRRHILWRGGRSKVLLLGHYDTVWPIGTLNRAPFTVENGMARGPGVLDMKAGIVQIVAALDLLGPAREGVTVLLTADEEIGSHTSRALIENAANEARAVLVCEASAPDGAMKIARRGVAHYRLCATGKAAHAGEEPERGINATVELAFQVPRILALADDERDVTVTPTVLRSGTSANSVPETAQLDVDVRSWAADELARVDAAIRKLRPLVEGAQLDVSGGISRPAFESDQSEQIMTAVGIAANRIGAPPPTGVRWRSGSDANITAALGVPTLCGFGAVGAHPHARDEYVVVEAMPARAALLAATVEELITDG